MQSITDAGFGPCPRELLLASGPVRRWTLEDERKTGCHEDDAPGNGADALVHESRLIAELPGQRVLRDDPHPHLVGDEDDLARGLAEHVKETVDIPFGRMSGLP